MEVEGRNNVMFMTNIVPIITLSKQGVSSCRMIAVYSLQLALPLLVVIHVRRVGR